MSSQLNTDSRSNQLNTDSKTSSQNTDSFSSPQNTLILVGSPKAKKSASNNISQYIKDKIHENGVEAEIVYIAKHQKPDKMEKLVKRASESELLIIVAPLYIDSIPAIAINFMENYYNYHGLTIKPVIETQQKILAQQVNETQKEPKIQQRLLAIFNSGFPEPNHNDLAIDMCKNFASQTDMEWAGGITIGMGAAFENRSLNDAGGMARNLRNGLDNVVESLVMGVPVPSEAELIASKPLLPLFLAKFVMRWFGGRMWKSRVNDKSVRNNMNNRPYET